MEEAICFGWIDGKMRSVDDKKYILRFSPRRRDSIWSEMNRQRAVKMMNRGKMTKAGNEKIDEAKKNGSWASAYSSKKEPPLPDDLKKALMKDEKTWRNFSEFSNSLKTRYIYWINVAKREETRERRIREIVKKASHGKKRS